MTDTEFKDVVNRIKDRLDFLCDIKGKEYSTEQDRLSTFKRTAALEKNQPEQALLHMVAKQIISLFDIVDSLTPDTKPHPDGLLEKTGDVIVYMILLQALIEERYYVKQDR